MAGGNRYYWDTCIFLAWLRDEERKPGEMDGVREYIEKLKRRDIVLMTSTLTFAEVTETKAGAGTIELFDQLLRRKNLQRIGVDTKIAMLARNLRDYYWERPEKYNNLTLSVPDALHLATAILWKATEFHTFDASNRRQSLGLLPLSGNVGGHSLVICKPEAKQFGLELT